VVPRVSGLVFIFCALGLNFGGTEGIVSRFYVLCSRTHFRRYRERRVPFSCFVHSRTPFGWYRVRRITISSVALQDLFWALLRAPCPVFMFCALVLIFDCTESVGYHFLVLRSWTHFRRYRGRRVPFSYFALLNSFSPVPRASGLVFIF
jgi:hypothetical protein